MASGYVTSLGAWDADDLDDILKARVSAKGADVGYEVAGVDISNRYEALGGGTKTDDVGYESGGSDISNLLAGKNAIIDPWSTEPEIRALAATPTTADARCYLYDTGSWEMKDDVGGTKSGDFLTTTGAGEADSFYWMWHHNSGDNANISSVAADTWVAIDQTHYVGLTASASTPLGNFSISIADNAIGTDAVTWTGDITARSL